VFDPSSAAHLKELLQRAFRARSGFIELHIYTAQRQAAAAAARVRERFQRAFRALDSFVESRLYEARRQSGESYESLVTYMERFHVTGWRRILVEFCCEASNVAIGVGLVALFLATPAFKVTSDSDDWLKKQDLAVTFLDRYGQEVGRRGIKHDDSVSFDELPKYLIEAVVATEDRRFFDHFGIDPIGTLRALTVNARASTVVQGGSSITQQLAKNIFLSNERTLIRKIKEAYLALWLERHLSKRRILQLYLDRVYMGGGTFGVQAASQFYFDKSVRDLTLSEAAMLAGLFKAPTKYAPHINLPAARARANDVLNNMVEAGYLTQGQIYAAEHNPATPVARSRETSPDWYLDWAYDEVQKLADAGKLGNDRVLTVRTALDLDLQKHADATIEDQLRQNGPSFHAKQSATVALDPSTGAVRAIVGGRDYGASQFNRAIYALRQPGSSFKPFVYFTALLSGKFKPSTIVVDSPVCIGDWCPQNYGGKFSGRLPLVNALAHSLNSIAVKLSIALGEQPGHTNVFEAAKRGRAKIVATARRMGITTPLVDTVSLPIGAAEVTMMEMAGAYAVFANGGKRVQPFAAIEITNSRGELIYRHDRDVPAPQQIFDPATVIEMDGMLRQVVEAGTGRRAHLDNTEVAGKTGTTNGYKDAWFIGFTGNYVCAVWYGNDDDTSMNNMTGGTLPAATWHEIMAFAHQGIELKPLPGQTPPAAAKPQEQTTESTAAEAGAPDKAANLSRNAADVLGTIASTAQNISAGRTSNAPSLLSFANGGNVAKNGFSDIGNLELH
jgi:penicillin-binding protein 1A